MSAVRRFFLALGDILALYAALFAALFIRYRSSGDVWVQFLDAHVGPFSLIFAVWLCVFYIAGLYEARKLRNSIEFSRTLVAALIINALLSVLVFYLTPFLGIAPKTTLLLTVVIFAIFETLWRQAYNRLLARAIPPLPVALIGDGAAGEAIYQALKENPQLGYSVAVRILDPRIPEGQTLHALIQSKGIRIVVIPRRLMDDPATTSSLYTLLMDGVEILETPIFYETLFRKVPLSELEEGWFIENLSRHQKHYDGAKSAVEFLAAALLQTILIPVDILIAIAIKITSPGPVIYSQKRIGKNGRVFTLYKFRSMRNDAEKSGAQWSRPGDTRVTPIGKVLRASHLDEFPQLINIMKGDLSFVGPRPERPEFVETLSRDIPHFKVRHLVKPGITGWAQVSYRYGSTVDDAREKLQHDIYYIKNRSLVLDIAILLKTLRTLFVNEK